MGGRPAVTEGLYQLKLRLNPGYNVAHKAQRLCLGFNVTNKMSGGSP